MALDASTALVRGGVPYAATLRAKAVLSVVVNDDAAGRKVKKAKAEIVVKRPGMIRVTVFGPMKRVIAVLAGDPDNCFIFSDGIVRRCEWNGGEAADGGFFRFIDPALVVPFVLGDTDMHGVTKGGDKDSYILKKLAGQATSSKGTGGKVTVTASDYREVAGVKVPFSITIENGAERLTIEYKTVELNSELDERLFKLTLSVPAAQGG